MSGTTVRASDPAAFPPDRWVGKIDEMKEPIARAGVLPPGDDELEAVAGFLRKAAAAMRTGE